MSLTHTQIAALAQELHPYCNQSDFSLHPKLVEVAYNQVVVEGNVMFSSQSTLIKNSMIKSMTNTEVVTGKDLMRIGKGMDFSWSIYDKCISFCDQNNLKNLYYIAPPTAPSTVEDALVWFNMSELKAVLKEKGQPVGGKRSDLEARMLDCITISDLQKPLVIKRQEKVDKAKKKSLEIKYEQLLRFVNHRAYFLRQIAQNFDNPQFEPELLFLSGSEADERLLAKALDGTGFDTVILDGKFCKLLPLFPGSMTTHTLRYRRSSRGNQNNAAQPNRKLESILGFFKRN